MRGLSIAGYLTASLAAVALATAGLRVLGVTSPTTVALTYLLVVLFAASSTTLAVAVGTSLAAVLSTTLVRVRAGRPTGSSPSPSARASLTSSSARAPGHAGRSSRRDRR